MPRGGSRDLKKEKFWRRMIAAQARSGLSVRVWCRRRHLREPSFYWWRSRVDQTDRHRQRPSAKPTLVPVHVSQPEVGWPECRMEIVLPSDRCIRVRGPVDRQMLSDVLAVLETSPC